MSRWTMAVAVAVVLAVALGAPEPAAAQSKVEGEWAVTFGTPMGVMEFSMAISQNGTKLTGHLTSDVGEFPLKGSVNGDEVTIEWTLNDNGKMVDITFKGKVDGDKIGGTARLGNIGTGAFSADRTS